LIDQVIEKEVFSIKHTDFWKSLIERLETEVRSTLKHILHNEDINLTVTKMARLQGENKIKEIVENFPQTYIKLQEKPNYSEKDLK
jgi:hypothetical protein